MFLNSQSVLKEALESDISLPDQEFKNIYPTLNNYGHIFNVISPLGDEFIKNESSHHTLLEIGGGFGNIALECLLRGVKEYTVNDISKDHLKLLTLKIWQKYGNDSHRCLKNLKLYLGKVPEVLLDIENYYDAILIDKVMHFLLPNEIEQFFKWTYKALKPQGKLYISTLSCFNHVYKEKLLPYYDKRKLLQIPFPGFMEEVNDFRTIPSTILPKQMVAVTFQELKSLGIKYGFSLNKHIFLKYTDTSDCYWECLENEQFSDFICAILEKNYLT